MATDHDAAGRSGRRILCLTGPESTGKTTLARELAARLGATLVEEVARAYLEDRPADPAHPPGYRAEDVLTIARQQVAAEAEALERAGGLVVCDTDLTVIQVWWEEKYGELPGELCASLAGRTERAYLLLAPDLPWVPDPLRENPHDRARLFQRYQALLEAGPFPHGIVSGTGRARLESALALVRVLWPELDISEGP